jgi:predicted nucleotidyltransferase
MKKINRFIKERRDIADKLFKLLDKDARVNFALTIGSTANNTENELSDIDVCIVMKDDNGLNGILRELNIIFASLGKMVDYYEYSPYHFYVIYENCIPLDIYIISSSVYFIIKKTDNKTMVDHSKKNIGAETTDSDKEEIINKLFLKGWIRTFRLLSKVERNDFVTLIYILNQIKEDQIIPLLSLIYGYNIPHSKAVKLYEIREDLKNLFIKTYAKPTAESTLEAIRSMAELLKIMNNDRVNTGEKNNKLAENAYSQIMSYVNKYSPR